MTSAVAPSSSTPLSTDLWLQSPDGGTRLALAAASGGRWSSLQQGGLEFLGRGDDHLMGWGSFAMAPFAGRIRDGVLTWQGHRHQLPLGAPPHAIHGVTLDRAWEVVSHQEDAAELRCDFDSRWPWPGHATQITRVEDGAVHARLEVHADHAPMPAWSGFHPWFARQLAWGEPVQITLPTDRYLPRDESGMPSAEPAAAPSGPWDDTFVEPAWPAVLTWPGAARLELYSPADYLVVFDGRPGAVCLEPQTAPPNAVELGRAPVVSPGEPLVLEMTLRLSVQAQPPRESK